MPEKKNHGTPGVEPQSYGSTEDWLEGDTAQTVQNTPAKTGRHDEAFYRSDHDADDASASEAPADTRLEAPREARRDTSAVEIVAQSGKKVPESNETRQSYFRRRDYD